jgi:WD40 repeat protein
MIKIRLKENETQYDVEFIFDGYEYYIHKAIELTNTFKIITCSWDDKLFVWEKINEMNYINSLKFNEGERVVDLLEINTNIFVSISESNELKIWNSNTFEIIDIIKNIKCIGSPNALCKINDFILSVLDYHEIQLIDIMEHKLVNKITIDDGNLSCIVKLNDNSILLAEDYNNDKYCVFYIKQFYFENNDLIPISHKKDKFFKTNKNNDKEIRALVQFSNGVIVQGIAGEYNGKDSGYLFFYY